MRPVRCRPVRGTSAQRKAAAHWARCRPLRNP
ncbi:MAG: phage DNA packaging protein J [Citromicrobium sp.]|nr:phage DNA packaging protein J [Citromicrobium sp.]